MADLPIRANLVILCVLRAREGGHDVLLMKRTQTLAGEWGQVSGRIEEGEKAWQTALRELHEETGLRLDRLFTSDICETFYGATANAIYIAPVFVGYVSEPAEVVLNFEHSAFRWVPFDEAVEMVPYGGQRRALRQIEAEYSQRVPNRYLQIAIG